LSKWSFQTQMATSPRLSVRFITWIPILSSSSSLLNADSIPKSYNFRIFHVHHSLSKLWIFKCTTCFLKNSILNFCHYSLAMLHPHQQMQPQPSSLSPNTVIYRATIATWNFLKNSNLNKFCSVIACMIYLYSMKIPPLTCFSFPPVSLGKN
jgi:hypothetical protein